MSIWHGLLAVSPMLVFLLLFVGVGLLLGDVSKVPLIVVFLLTSFYALLTMRHVPVAERITCFSKGAGTLNLLLMIWIFILAGAFAQTAKDMGSIDSVVNLTLKILPANWLLASLFLSACFVSLSIGTSVGTIVALVPVAAGIADKSGFDTALVVATVVGGAFFGDNLSFISDTTIASTRTQECKLNDKFKVNFKIALPAALLTFLIYVFIGSDATSIPAVADADFIKVVPYLLVLVVVILGANVLVVLSLGILLSGLIGIAEGAYTFPVFVSSIATGVMSMSELIIVTMLAGGLLAVVRQNGGIDFLMRCITKLVNGKRMAELSIALLVSVTNLCTANNTVAILSVGDLARQISDRYHIDRRKSASLLDIFSCVVQGLIPYGAQLLMAAGLASVNPVSITPYLYYPVILCAVALLGIAFRYPRKYS